MQSHTIRHSLILASFAAGLFLTSCQTTTPAPGQFDQADGNADGNLSSEEASDYLVRSNFVTRDANKDNRVTRAEWNPENDPASVKLFAQRDADKDGVVTLEEARTYATKKGSYDQVIKDADTNKDGLISRAEATAYTASKEGPVR